MSRTLFEEIKRIRAIADVGLLYATSGYEKERYHELIGITDRLFATITDESLEKIHSAFDDVKDYPTVKVDVRAFVLKDQKILMVRESADGKWSLPGGWADIGFSPKEVAVKEVKEETGFDVSAKRLLAVFDKKMHAHPPQPHYVYKIVIHCQLEGGSINKGFDVLDVGFFPIDKLPELSENRILSSQIQIAYDKVVNDDPVVYLD